MFCYQCGCELDRGRSCPNCGTDVRMYKRIQATSNYFYNEGLEKASVRDLSGAIVSLRQSIRFNKNNIDARNLLGLCYFDMGETVAALSEWVISCNISPENNLADEYLAEIQKSQNKVEQTSQTIRKYNQALTYCYQGSLDLAVIQLKKVLSMNPRFVRAHQLLALLYINERNWAKARRELKKCMAIDTNNTTTLRYMQEVREQTAPEGGIPEKKDLVTDDNGTVTYRNGNEMIIQPAGSRNPALNAGRDPVIYGIIGFLLGAALIGFLVLPARVQKVRQEALEQVRTVSEQLDSMTAQGTSRDTQLEALSQENETLKAEIAQYAGTSRDEKLEKAVSDYLSSQSVTDAVVESFTAIGGLNEDDSEGFKALYNSLYEIIRPSLSRKLYNLGMAAMLAEKPDYDTAAEYLEKAYAAAESGDDGYSTLIYYLANAYYRQYEKCEDTAAREEMLPNLAKAKKLLQEIIAGYPDAEHYEDAEGRLENIDALNLVLPEITEE